METVSKEFDEQPGYSERYVDNRDVDHFVPEQTDSLVDQDNRPEVECKDLDSEDTRRWNVVHPFIHDETVPEDDLGTDETLCGMGVDSHRRVIQKYFSRIEKELDVRAISGDLFSEEVLDFDQKQAIDSKNTNKAANTILATNLHQTADSTKLEGFLKVLESDKAHPKHVALAKEMRDHLTQLSVSSYNCMSCRLYL